MDTTIIELKPDDVLIFQPPYSLTIEEGEAMIAELKAKMPDWKIIVLQKDVSITVLKMNKLSGERSIVVVPDLPSP